MSSTFQKQRDKLYETNSQFNTVILARITLQHPSIQICLSPFSSSFFFIKQFCFIFKTPLITQLPQMSLLQAAVNGHVLLLGNMENCSLALYAPF